MRHGSRHEHLFVKLKVESRSSLRRGTTSNRGGAPFIRCSVEVELPLYIVSHRTHQARLSEAIFYDVKARHYRANQAIFVRARVDIGPFLRLLVEAAHLDRLRTR